MVTCPFNPEWKRSSEFDLNGKALPDENDDGVPIDSLNVRFFIPFSFTFFYILFMPHFYLQDETNDTEGVMINNDVWVIVFLKISKIHLDSSVIRH